MSENTGNSRCRHFTAAHQAEVLRQRLVQKKAFSDVCDEHGIQPSLFHGRQKQLFDGIEAVLAGKARGGRGA